MYLWAYAYFQPGTVNCGFDVWLERASFTKNCTACTLELSTLGLCAGCAGAGGAVLLAHARARCLGGTVLPSPS